MVQGTSLRQTGRRKHVFVAVVAATVLFASLAFVPTSAGAELRTKGADPAVRSTDPFASIDPAVLANQAALGSFKTWLIKLPGIYDAGFVESANYPNKATTLLWAGSSPLQAVVRAEAARRGITVTFKAVRFSRPELDRAAKTLWATRNSPKWAGFVMTSLVGTDLSHDGFRIEGHYPRAFDSAPSRQAALNATLRVARTLSPLVQEIDLKPPLVLATRRDTDVTPFNSGGFMRAKPGSPNHCSSGFAVWFQGTARTTTARHCHDGPFQAWHASSGEACGSSTPYQCYGNGIANTGSGGKVLQGLGFYWMFDGAYNDANGYHKNTLGFFDLSLNDMVCQSGGNSGIHCGLKVDNLLRIFNDGWGSMYSITATQTVDEFFALQLGDSGSPVLVPYTGGVTVGAAGMVQFATGRVDNCQQSWTYPSGAPYGYCYHQVGFTSMRTIVRDLGSGAGLWTVNGVAYP